MPHPALTTLLDAGLAEAAGIDAVELTAWADGLPDDPGTVLVVHPSLVPTRHLVPLLRRGDRPGFVVEDLTDLEEFRPIAGLEVPDRPLYLLHGVDRGDDLRNASPDEALPELTSRGRTPLTVAEGVSWLLQDPSALQPNHCFMTVGSRRSRGRGLDPRTPALWISGGTGRDGRERRDAPKLGWCWAGNRHTWLGFASAIRRGPVSEPSGVSTPDHRAEPSPTSR